MKRLGMQNESRPHDYMHLQTDVNEKMRAILIDWLIDVHQKFELSPEALYLTINLIDRFLSVKIVPRRELQLLGMSAMLIATKYEEIWPPEVYIQSFIFCHTFYVSNRSLANCDNELNL